MLASVDKIGLHEHGRGDATAREWEILTRGDGCASAQDVRKSTHNVVNCGRLAMRELGLQLLLD